MDAYLIRLLDDLFMIILVPKCIMMITVYDDHGHVCTIGLPWVVGAPFLS
jgi:hypothetical protein